LLIVLTCGSSLAGIFFDLFCCFSSCIIFPFFPDPLPSAWTYVACLVGRSVVLEGTLDPPSSALLVLFRVSPRFSRFFFLSCNWLGDAVGPSFFRHPPCRQVPGNRLDIVFFSSKFRISFRPTPPSPTSAALLFTFACRFRDISRVCFFCSFFCCLLFIRSLFVDSRKTNHF